MPVVDLIYDQGCPNIKTVRMQLLQAFSLVGVSARWREWDRAAPDTPSHFRAHGSPTVLIDGADVAGNVLPVETTACRVYTNERGGFDGVPPVALIQRALMSGSNDRSSMTARVGLFGPAPAIGAALLPKLTCPLCWPAYAALLSSLGLGFFDYTPYLFPLTTAFVLMSLTVLGWVAWRTSQVSPFIVGIVGGVVLIVGKFFFASDITAYVGIALLILASIVPLWWRRSTACPKCLPTNIPEVKK